MTFKALLLEKNDSGIISQDIHFLDESILPDGDVTIDIKYSTLNYKDGLCLMGKSNLVQTYPHIPGIDFAGIVTKSSNVNYKIGDEVILTGWHVGETWWGGYATKASVKAEWLVPMPQGMTLRQSMAFGTAGLSAMLGIIALEEHGLKPEQGKILVTGASGGVGSTAISLLSQMGYNVVALTRQLENTDFLNSIGASEIILAQYLSENSSKPLLSERWAGVIDAAGGDTLSQVLKQVKFGGSVAAIGLAAGAYMPSFTIIPFLLRGINLLGIDSVSCSYKRRMKAWKRLADLLPIIQLDTITQEYVLEDLPKLGSDILQGQIQGRILINPNR